MPIVESLVVGLGSAVACGVFKMWLKDDSILESTATGLTEILKAKITDIFQRGAAERELTKIRERSAQSFQRLIEKEQSSLSEDEIELIANAAAAVINQTAITPELLAQNNLAPEDLAAFFISRSGNQGGNPGLATNLDPAKRSLFERFLIHASQQIIDISSRMPLFTERVFSELLQRENQIYLVASRVLEGMDHLLAAQKGIDPDAERFETNYRMACVRKFDQLELFGVDLQESNRRYRLSVAYVTLEVENTKIPDSEQGEDLAEEGSEPVPAHEALARSTRLLVRGVAGSGKTTFVQWTTVYCAGRQHDGELLSFNELVPFVITLRDFDNSPLPNPDDFARVVAPHIGGEPHRWSHRILDMGRAIVLIDGLDEASEEQRSAVRDWLRDLIAQYPKARYIVTTRPHAVQEGWLDADGFLDTTLQEMAPEDIGRFVEHWHEAVASGFEDEATRERISKLQAALSIELRKNSDLMRLATSPLLCAIICSLHRDRNRDLPTDRVGLYRACIEMFFRRDRERRVSMSSYVELDDTQKLFLLRSLAWWLIRNGKSSATPEEVHQKFESALAELNNRPQQATGLSVAKLFVQRVAILRQFAAGKIDFPHRTFQEYLAAQEALAERDYQLVIDNAEKEQWREVAILMAGLIEKKTDAEQFVMGLLQRGDEIKPQQETLYLIGAAARNVVHRLPESSKLETEVRDRLGRIIPPKSMKSAEALSKAGNLVVPMLSYDRRRRAPEVSASARTLALVNTPEAIAALLDYTVDDRETVLRQVESSLRFINDEEHVEFQRRILETRFQARDIFPLADYLDLSGLSLTDLQKIQECTLLQCLHLRYCRQLTDISVLENCKSLESLDLTGCSQLSDISVLEKCTALDSLELGGCSQLSDISVLEKCTALESLCLQRCSQLSSMSVLEKCTALDSLDLSGCSQLSSISVLEKSVLLHSLDLSWCTGLSDISVLEKLTSLEWLDLSWCTELSDISVLEKCISLSSLDLGGCSQLSDISVLKKCALLESLNLSGCTQLSSLSVLEKCTALESLELCDCTQLFDISVLEKCASLKSLNVCGCAQLSDISVLEKCTSLESLDLSCCPGLSDISVLEKCTSLKWLALSGCTELSDINVLAKCTSLESLNLNGCAKITDISVLEKCASLEFLDLRGCSQVTDISVLEKCISLMRIEL